jgi:nucleoid-associated protein YgaU
LKRQNILKPLIILSLVGSISSSCGLIDKFKTSEQPVDSKVAEPDSVQVQDSLGVSESDDLFSKTMSENKEVAATETTDAPSNITTEPALPEVQPTPQIESTQVKVEESLPEIKAEAPPVEVAALTNNDAGKEMSYKVQKGETLMQIAFKIYGDISKWKSIEQINGAKLSKNSALRSGMELKYIAPEKAFVWSPEGTPHLIKTGETLGTISNSVYQTPKKWKNIWENNKPLIKNPNVIYAGFTLYYKGNGMANYVQPKTIQKKLAAKVEAEVETISEAESKAIEEVKVDQAISNLEMLDSTNEIDLTKNIQSAPIRNTDENLSNDIKTDEIEDEALVP